MTGILLIGVLIIWFIVALVIALSVTSRVSKAWLKPVVGLPLFAALLVAPLADELLAKPKFEALCQREAVVQVHKQPTEGRKVYFKDRVLRKFEFYGLKIQMERLNYSDITTNESIVSYTSVLAQGGWFMRELGISETKSPLLFDKYCGPKDSQTFQQELGITTVNRSAQTIEETK